MTRQQADGQNRPIRCPCVPLKGKERQKNELSLPRIEPRSSDIQSVTPDWAVNGQHCGGQGFGSFVLRCDTVQYCTYVLQEVSKDPGVSRFTDGAQSVLMLSPLGNPWSVSSHSYSLEL
jgi:hypothetical protein